MISRRIFSFGVGLLALWQLTGCAGFEKNEALRFCLKGRFSYSASSPSGKRENLSGKFSFKRSDTSARLDLLSPVNSVLARIEATDGQAFFFRHTGEKPITAPNVEMLMKENLGFGMPFFALEEWATATDTPKSYGWQLQVLKRENERPKLLRIRRIFNQTEIKITITFDEVYP